MYAPKSRAELLNAYEELGVPVGEVDELREILPKIEHSLELYLQLAAKLRPNHVFDATYYHASELTYRFALSQFKTDARAWGNFGVLMQEWGRYGDAISYHERALEIAPTYSNAYINLGFCYELAGDFDKAANAMNRSIELAGPDAVPLTGLGNCARHKGDLPKALRYYESALEIEQNCNNALFMKAVVLAGLKRWKEAESTIEILRQLGEKDAGAKELERSILGRELPRLTNKPRRPFERWSSQMRDAPHSHWRDDGPWGWVVDVLDWNTSPLNSDIRKIFISYRWGTADQNQWVSALASQISDRGYKVILDQFSPENDDQRERYRNILRQLSDTALFVPILTNKYRRRVEAVGDLSSDVRTGVALDMGRAFDEWTVALVLASIGRLRMLGLWRQGPTVAVPFTPETVVDVRGVNWATNVCKAFPNRTHFDRSTGTMVHDEYLHATRYRSRTVRLDDTSPTKPAQVPEDLFEAIVRLDVPKLQEQIVCLAP